MDKNGAKRWVFLFRFGPLKEMGLGGLIRANLAEARRLGEWCRGTLAKGLNPIEVRKAAGRVPTFGECADEFVATEMIEHRGDVVRSARLGVRAHGLGDLRGRIAPRLKATER